MRDVVYRPSEQFLLAVTHKLAHRFVGAEETTAFGFDLELAYATDIEHGAERRFVLKARSNLGEFRAALLNAVFQLAAEPSVAFNGKAHPSYEDHRGKSRQNKQQQGEHFAWMLNVKRPAGRQHEKISRGSAEDDAKKASSEAADQSCDDDRGKERNVLNAHNIWINGDPQCQGKRSGQESEGIGPDGSPPQRRDINVN
jgi:hypothetical protein